MRVITQLAEIGGVKLQRFGERPSPSCVRLCSSSGVNRRKSDAGVASAHESPLTYRIKPPSTSCQQQRFLFSSYIIPPNPSRRWAAMPYGPFVVSIAGKREAPWKVDAAASRGA